MRRGLLLAAVLLISSLVLPARSYSVSGHVTDASSGEPLIGVAVFEEGGSSGTVTGSSGFYSISLEPGGHVLVFSCLGYKEHRDAISLNGNVTVDIRLSEENDELEGAVVISRTGDIGVRGTQMSAIEVPISQIRTIPAIGGEVDVIKALQLLPGVQPGTEGSAGFYVRGGGPDENLMLMDGVPLYNVNHMMGFFSIFNADAIKNVTLYKGSFPARFGGHLSSVVDIRLNDGNENAIHGSATVGLISSRINVEGPIVKGRTTFNVSARRTYLDLLAKPVMMISNSRNSIDGDNYTRNGGGYDFYDLNAKITHRLGNGDRLSLSFYSGSDAASVKENIASKVSGDMGAGARYRTTRDTTATGWRWGNSVAALRWNHTAGPKLHMCAAVSYTGYRSVLSVSQGSYYAFTDEESIIDEATSSLAMTYRSVISDISATTDMEWYPSARHDIKFGGGYTFHEFNPGIVTMSLETGTNTVGDMPVPTHEAAVYFEDNWSPLPWLKVNMGLRTSFYGVNGTPYFSTEPRVSMRALITDNLSVKASYSEMGQYIHLLSNSNLSLPSDLWVPVTDRIGPMRSRQTAAGAYYELGRFEFSLEGYWKTMDNVLEYKDGASYFGMSSGWEDKVSVGRGWSYGVELLVQKKTGRTTGWIGYTLSRSMRQFDSPGNVINGGDPFPAKYDRRHDLSATVTHKLGRRFDLSGTFVFASGNCGSLALESSAVGQVTGAGSTADFAFMNAMGYLPNRNNFRMPAYNRMDVGMNFYREKRHGTAIWNISVYNIYNRLNPFMLRVGETGEFNEAKSEWVYTPHLYKVSIFPILPSFSYTFKF